MRYQGSDLPDRRHRSLGTLWDGMNKSRGDSGGRTLQRAGPPGDPSLLLDARRGNKSSLPHSSQGARGPETVEKRQRKHMPLAHC